VRKVGATAKNGGTAMPGFTPTPQDNVGGTARADAEHPAGVR
jgi:hypothetical protein